MSERELDSSINDYIETERDRQLILERIKLRLTKK